MLFRNESKKDFKVKTGGGIVSVAPGKTIDVPIQNFSMNRGLFKAMQPVTESLQKPAATSISKPVKPIEPVEVEAIKAEPVKEEIKVEEPVKEEVKVEEAAAEEPKKTTRRKKATTKKDGE